MTILTISHYKLEHLDPLQLKHAEPSHLISVHNEARFLKLKQGDWNLLTVATTTFIPVMRLMSVLFESLYRYHFCYCSHRCSRRNTITIVRTVMSITGIALMHVSATIIPIHYYFCYIGIMNVNMSSLFGMLLV